MNDLEGIKEIEETFGFSLNRVDLENLFEEKSFFATTDSYILSFVVNPYFILDFGRKERLKSRIT